MFLKELQSRIYSNSKFRKEMEEVCELSVKKVGGMQDVFDSKVFDDLLCNFNDKCPLLHSIQTLW